MFPSCRWDRASVPGGSDCPDDRETGPAAPRILVAGCPVATDPKRRVMGAQRRPDQLSTGLPRGLGTLTRARPTWTRTAWTGCTCWVTRRVSGSRSNWPAGAGRCRWCRSPRVGSAPRWNVPTRAAVMITTRMINRVRYPWLDELARTPAGRSVLLAGMRAMPWQASPADALTMKDGFADQTGFLDHLVERDHDRRPHPAWTTSTARSSSRRARWMSSVPGRPRGSPR